MLFAKLHPRLQDFVKDKNWPDLTPIQKEAFDPIFRGESCVIEAPTSGGKTEAVLFPLLTRLKANKTSGFKVLYIAPLKALLNDLALRVIPYSERCYLKAFKWHGDVSQGDKIQQMNFPSDILLTTPESIEAILLRRAKWREVFQNLETIVIDEAHYFALTERGSHLISLLQRIEAEIKLQPQRIAVTATIGNPDELLEWLVGKNKGGRRIQVSGNADKKRNFLIQYYEDEGVALDSALYNSLINKKTIVFERSRSQTENTATKINQRNDLSNSRNSVKVKTHHSSVSKRLREEAEGSIKQINESSLNAIICTSTLELGIDIGDLDQVVQIGGLNSSGSFLQRVGRTGRRSNQEQYFRGLCADEDELILLTGCVSLGMARVSEKILFPKKAFHILAHQIICLCLQKMGATADSIWNILSGAHCFSKITRAEFDTLISFMATEDFLRIAGGQTLLTSNKTESEFLRANWKRLFAIFDTGSMYNVVDGKKVIGTLDSGFARSQQLPFVFVLGGLEWNAIKLDHELQQVSVEKNKTGVPPKWKAVGDYDVPFELAQEVGRLLMNNERSKFLDQPAAIIIDRRRNEVHGLNWKPGKWIIESSDEFGQVYIWTFAGDKINRVLKVLLGLKLTIKPEYDYQKVIIGQPKEKHVNITEVSQIISDLKSEGLSALESMVQKQIEVKWFSKFSDCLPDSLAKQTICEKDYDVLGFLAELEKLEFDNKTAPRNNTSSNLFSPKSEILSEQVNGR